MSFPTTQISHNAFKKGSDILKMIAEILREQLEIEVDVNPIETEGLPMQAVMRVDDNDVDDPYWIVWWDGRESHSTTFGTFNYQRQKTYNVMLRGFWMQEPMDARSSEWSDTVEQIADWLESHRSLKARAKIMSPPTIEDCDVKRETGDNDYRYYHAMIRFTVQVNDRVTRN